MLRLGLKIFWLVRLLSVLGHLAGADDGRAFGLLKLKKSPARGMASVAPGG